MREARATINDMRTGGLDFRELCNLSVGSILSSLLWILLPLNVLVCAGCAVWCAVWTGVSHSLCAWRVKAAVDKIESTSEGGINRPRQRCSLNLFEYHDVLTTGLQVSKVVSLWVLSQVLLFMPVVWILAQYLSYSNDTWSVLHVVTLAWMVLYVFLFVFFLCGAAVVILKSGEDYRTQPFHFRTRVLLVVSAMVFAMLLYFSPAPSTWRWTLIAIHSIRVSNVFTSLLCQVGVVEGITEREVDLL